jgi:hypothetical protein
VRGGGIMTKEKIIRRLAAYILKYTKKIVGVRISKKQALEHASNIVRGVGYVSEKFKRYVPEELRKSIFYLW